eukprot:CAMPEP_0168497030 /NCGR_PEP_ID=MMETSP0228-20121227/72561_1 /TAXON_ID=133427 /ORGANISM="Protoceratium reticulatum, Strain CCCM 535 (=CCMP 1889)" /LENGTH=139 /DNA_ID=CAMNT_0008513905 /DNA_START=186 /DNA_END=602 /DNA_ORIENTATION=+
MWLAGLRAFFRDCWCVFDCTVVALTVMDWSLHFLRQALLAEEVLKTPLFALRFVLQPCRVLAAVSMVRRVHQMQQGVVDVAFDILKPAEVTSPELGLSRILSGELQAVIAANLPAWCRFRKWQLVYAPHVHGTSMQTFF